MSDDRLTWHTAQTQGDSAGLRLRAPGRWLPATTPQRLEVSLGNLGSQPVCFALLDTLQFSLSGPTGQPIPLQHSRDGLAPAPVCTLPVAPGAWVLVRRRCAVQHTSADATSLSHARLSIEDGFGGTWLSQPLPRSGWRLACALLQPLRPVTTALAPLWPGRLLPGPSVPVAW